MIPRPILAAAVLALAAGPVLAADAGQTAARLRDRALGDPTAYELVKSLTTEVGSRPAGSPGAERARDWGVARLKALGFDNIRVEPFQIVSWSRGPESAELVAPYRQKLEILGLGRSASTPPGGVEAEIALFRTYAEMLAVPPGGLAGKIAVVTQPMARTQDGSGYGAASPFRTRGPSEAGKRGALAYLVRSISTSDARAPHTGAMRRDEPRIPAAALSVADAELLERLAALGGPVRIRLSLSSTENPAATAWNVSGDIKGDRDDEVVVIGAHIDAWDPAQGAIDDAAGVGITIAAARLVGELPGRTRRTIRVVMFGDEEMDNSGKAFAEAHKDRLGEFVVAAESDLGAGRSWSLQLPAGAAGAPQLAPLAQVLGPLKVPVAAQPAISGGADFAEAQRLGVPVFSFRQDATRYFDIHHSADDTLDKVDPDDLNQNVAAWSALLYLIADSDIDFRALAPAAAPAR